MATNQNKSRNTSINSPLINAAKEFTHALWLRANKQGITEHNLKIQSQGTYSERIKQL